MHPVVEKNCRVFAHIADTTGLITAMGQRLLLLIQAGVIPADDPLFIQWELLASSSCDLTRACTEAL